MGDDARGEKKVKRIKNVTSLSCLSHPQAEVDLKVNLTLPSTLLTTVLEGDDSGGRNKSFVARGPVRRPTSL